MYLNPAHREFDFSSEILCMLSTVPQPVRLIASDLGMTPGKMIRSHFMRLRTRGIEVVTESDPQRPNQYTVRIGYASKADRICVESGDRTAGGGVFRKGLPAKLA